KGVNLEVEFLRNTKEGLARLLEADGFIREVESQDRQEAFRSAILNEPSTSVSDGLSRVNDAGQEVPLQPRYQPKPVSVDPEKLVARARRGTATVGDLKREIAAPESTSVLDGLTYSGKPAREEGARIAAEKREREVALWKAR